MTVTSLQSNTSLEFVTTHFGFTTVAKEEKVTNV
ncbi:bifunctional demethylmenaquinone methyltransferase/2-methoxy-6-polyprenyl-1,4-benzoquinol methylase UbiE, partial [Vibrio parahaemolyticus]|nr:bifunctional demethylmenaquinone methyltransferase/2-methoxy-6-polyprenyl-1,4-benzoquinol methylase UbiE [Vibrio parahaemolyticus]